VEVVAALTQPDELQNSLAAQIFQGFQSAARCQYRV
jgi:hypothetical protein